MTLGRCEKEKKKRRKREERKIKSSTDDYSMQDADEVTKSPFHFSTNKVYVTRPDGLKKIYIYII